LDGLTVCFEALDTVLSVDVVAMQLIDKQFFVRLLP